MTKKKILAVSNAKMAPEKATKPFICWKYNFFWFYKLYQNSNVLCIVIKWPFPLAFWKWVHSEGPRDALQGHVRYSVSQGHPTLIHQQGIRDTASPQSECTTQEGLLTKVHRGKNLWGSYEVVCFSSEWKKKGREGKGAPFFGIKIQLGLVWF